MKKAAIDQILVWMLLLPVFAICMFLVLDYSTVLRVKDNADAMSDYAARMVALGRSTDDIIIGLNKIKLPKVDAIISEDLECIDGVDNNYQVTFTIDGTYDSKFLTNNTITSKAVVFNEQSSVQKNCTLAININ